MEGEPGELEAVEGGLEDLGVEKGGRRDALLREFCHLYTQLNSRKHYIRHRAFPCFWK